ncbi:MAG: VOC family protein [Thermoplasmata archaeon]|nr:VOC family protein [Candidatus Sysuiplasma acidicola]MBX8646783.1 VOC family protein [Candidatus Sysuiplasma acidicola]
MFRDPQVNLYVDDVETSVAFYRDLFGFSETFSTPRHESLFEFNSGSADLCSALLQWNPCAHVLERWERFYRL